MSQAIEYLDPAIAGEGQSANNWEPGAWANTPAAADEWQPDIEPPHINDYAAFKKHKHYGQYFRPHRYVPFPAWMYHETLEPKIVKSREEVLALGPEWSPTPKKPRLDMTGKSLPVKSETQRLAEVIAQTMGGKQAAPSAGIDPTAIAAIVAAVMAAMQPATAVAATPALPDPDKMMPDATGEGAQAATSDDIERAALIELAEKDSIKIDKRWSNDRIKKELGL